MPGKTQRTFGASIGKMVILKQGRERFEMGSKESPTKDILNPVIRGEERQ